MQISIVVLLFSDQTSGRGKVFKGGQLPQGAPPAPLWEKPDLQGIQIDQKFQKQVMTIC